MTLIFLYFDLTKIKNSFLAVNRKWLSKSISSSIMTTRPFTVLEDSTVILSIKYIEN